MLISIVVTSYNYEKYLKDTINSVLAQTYQNWEMIVIDDASTDSSVEIIKEYQKKDKRIKLIQNETNLGLSKTLKKGLEAASGEWIAILESDDSISSDYLEKKAAVIKQYPDIGLIFNDVEMTGDKKRIKEVEKKFRNSAKSLLSKSYPCNLFSDLVFFNKVLTFSTILVNKEKLLSCDFNTPTDKLLDWWLLLHFARKHSFYYIPEKLTRWRLHTDSYIHKRHRMYYYPVNFLALIDILKTEKDLRLIPYIIIIFFCGISKIKVAAAQKLKTALGIPLRSENSSSNPH